MAKTIFLFIVSIFFVSANQVTANEPDSAYIFSYVTDKNNNRNGLHYAWSIDRKNWHSIGSGWRFLSCDFGNWGNQKRLI